MIAALLAVALAGPLTLEEVMSGIDSRVPAIAAADARIDGAQGGVLSKRGAFDPQLQMSGGQYGGKSVRQLAGASAGVVSALGPSLEAGWWRGAGDVPPYQGDLATSELGRLQVRAEVPLMDGLFLGDARAAVLDAREKVDAARAKGSDQRVKVRAAAAAAYWKWVATGAKLTIAEEQLALADRRDGALAAEVEQGTRARIDRIDNERALLERREKVIRAQQELQSASLQLSLYLRLPSGEVVVPGEDRLPTEVGRAPVARDEVADLERALRRPDVLALEAEARRAAIAVRRSGLALLPELDAWAEVRRDLGDGPDETRVGATLQVPVPQRKARGQLAESRAWLTEIEELDRGLKDAIGASVREGHVRREAAVARAELASQAAERATTVVELERRRFDLGASDLLDLLQREAALARARSTLVDAELHLRLADVALDAAVGVAEPTGS